MKTAVAFSGAGARIIFESGCALAVQQAQTKYDYLLGTSSGAITAAFLAAKQAYKLAQICLTVRNKNIYSHAPWKAFTREACFYDNTPLRKLLQNNLNTKAIQANPIPCIVNATDTKDWSVKSFVLNKLPDDQIVEAVLASTCVPVAFPRRNGLIDGGVVDDYPILDAIANKVDQVLLFSPTTIEPFNVRNVIDALGEFISISLYSQMTNEMRAMKALNSDVQVHVIQPDQPLNIGVLDFNAFPSVVERRAKIMEARDLALRKLHDLNLVVVEV